MSPTRLQAAGPRERAAGLGISAPRPHASALAAPRSLNDAQVPPGAALFISLPSPKRDSSLPHPRALRLSAGGSGRWEESQRVRNRGLGYRISNYTFLWSLPKSQQLLLSPSKERAPSPSGSAASIRPSPPRSRGASLRQEAQDHSIIYSLEGPTQGGSASVSSSEAPSPSTQ